MSTKVSTGKRSKVPAQSTVQVKHAVGGTAKDAELPVVNERNLKKKPKAAEKGDRIRTTATVPEINGVAEKKPKKREKHIDGINADLPPVRRGHGSMPTGTLDQAALAEMQQAIIVKKARMAKKSQAGDIAGKSVDAVLPDSKPIPQKLPPVARRTSMPTVMVSSINAPEGTLSPSSQPPARRPPIPPVRTKPLVKSDTDPTSEQSQNSTQDADTSPFASGECTPEPKSPRTPGPGAQPRVRLKPSLTATDTQPKQAPSVPPSLSGGKATTSRQSAEFDLESLLALIDDESLFSDKDNRADALARNSSQAPVAEKARGDAKNEKLARDYFGELFKSHQRALQTLKIYGSMQSVHDALPDELLMSEVNHSADALYNAMINASVDENQRIAFVDVAVDLAKREKAFGPSPKDHILQVLVVRVGNVWASKLAETHGNLSEDFAQRAKLHAARSVKFADLAKKLS